MARRGGTVALIVLGMVVAAAVVLAAGVGLIRARRRVEAVTWRAATASPATTRRGGTGQPLIIGHHGAAGYLPANTLASFELAIEQGADYIEPDLVETKDGVLVARHDDELSLTTDVASHPEFAARRSTKRIYGQTLTGWFTEDFTLAELKTLRVSGPAANRPARGTRYAIPTLQEIIDLVRADEKIYHRTIGLCIETKDAAYFASVGKPVETRLATVLAGNGLDRPDAPVIVESFEAGDLTKLRKVVSVKLVRLILPRTGPADPATSSGALQAIAGYATGIAVDRSWLSGPPSSGDPAGSPSATATGDSLVARAHQGHLTVYVYTLSAASAPPDPVAADHRPADPPALANALAQYRAYARLGVDGVFSDNPDIARQALG